MKTTVFLFHPNFNDSIVNKALAEAAKGASIEVRKVYELYPDGVIDVGAEQKALEATDRIVLQFPMYWYSSPSLLKQWEDDVLQYGWAYGSTGTALHGKELLIATSTGAQEQEYSATGKYKMTVEELLAPFKATCHMVGLTWLAPFVTYGTLGIEANRLNEAAKGDVGRLQG